MKGINNLQDLKSKWTIEISGWTVDAAFLDAVSLYPAKPLSQQLEVADAALELLVMHRVAIKDKIDGERVAEVIEELYEERVIKIAQKQDKGKPRYDLIPGDALGEIAKVITNGADKYSDRNWELGQPWGKVFGAMMRHCWAWWGGEELDKESGLHHMAHAGAEALFLLAYVLRKVGSDDRSLEQIIHSPVIEEKEKPIATIYVRNKYYCCNGIGQTCTHEHNRNYDTTLRSGPCGYTVCPLDLEARNNKFNVRKEQS